jgi:hypothetical protein
VEAAALIAAQDVAEFEEALVAGGSGGVCGWLGGNRGAEAGRAPSLAQVGGPALSRTTFSVMCCRCAAYWLLPK